MARKGTPPPAGLPDHFHVSDVRVRPIQGGHIVSHYQRNLMQPGRPGNTVETFHPNAKAAAAHMAALSQHQSMMEQMNTPGVNDSSPSTPMGSSSAGY